MAEQGRERVVEAVEQAMRRVLKDSDPWTPNEWRRDAEQVADATIGAMAQGEEA